MPQTSKDNLLNLINFLGRFKDLKRSGWLARKVSSPECRTQFFTGVSGFAAYTVIS
mgnify:CR=1 FL=1